MKIGIVCYPTFGGSGVVATELGMALADNGHEVHLYTYDKVENIPEGVIVKNGNEILDKSEIYRYKNGCLFSKIS